MKGMLCRLWHGFNQLFSSLSPLGDLFIRCWLANVFFKAGLTKIQSWQTTVFLFEHEYTVPLLSAKWAALLGTGVELIIPVLLVLGLGGRLPAFILFIFNIVAMYSYPFLLTEAGVEGFEDHFYWGILIMVTLLHGYGKFSLDTLLCRRWCKRQTA